MGIEKERFIDPPSEELICPICLDVFSDPVQLTRCKHAFCRSCVRMMIGSSSNCPICNQAYNGSLTECDRMAKNIWKGLRLKCRFSKKGCRDILTVETDDSHAESCQYRNREDVISACGPSRVPGASIATGGSSVSGEEEWGYSSNGVTCTNGCFSFGTLESPHTCIEFLKQLLAEKSDVLRDIEQVSEAESKMYQDLNAEFLTLQILTAEKNSQLDMMEKQLAEKDQEIQIRDLKFNDVEEKLLIAMSKYDLDFQVKNHELESEKAGLKSCREELQKLSVEMDVLRRHLNDARMRIGDQDSEIRMAEAEMKRKDAKILELTLCVTEKQNELNTAQLLIRAKDAKLSQLEVQTTSGSSQMHQESMMKEFETTIRAKDHRIQRQNETMIKLEEEVRERNSALDLIHPNNTTPVPNDILIPPDDDDARLRHDSEDSFEMVHEDDETSGHSPYSLMADASVGTEATPAFMTKSQRDAHIYSRDDMVSILKNCMASRKPFAFDPATHLKGLHLSFILMEPRTKEYEYSEKRNPLITWMNRFGRSNGYSHLSDRGYEGRERASGMNSCDDYSCV